MEEDPVIDERQRHELHQRLEAVLGPEQAAALMTCLPATEVATKEWVDLRLEVSEQRLRAELGAQTRTLVFALLGANATFGALAFAAARLG
jgi:hypothetical protein